MMKGTRLIHKKDYRNYEAEMMAFNKMMYLVPISVVHLSSGHEIQPMTEGFLSLVHLFEGEGAIACDLYELLIDAVVGAIEECGDYLIPAEHICFSIEDTYIGEEGFRFILMPSDQNQGIYESLKVFFDTIETILNKDDRNLVTRMHQIRLALQKQPFFIEDFLNTFRRNESVH